jgi:hypothetical protein
VRLGNISRFVRRIIRRKDSRVSDGSNNSSQNSKGEWIIVLGIVISVIGFAGAIYYGSQFVKEEVNAGATLPYTTPSHIKNILPMDLNLEIVFVVIAVIGFGILTYGLVGRVDKPLDFYPKWMNKYFLHITSETWCSYFIIIIAIYTRRKLKHLRPLIIKANDRSKTDVQTSYVIFSSKMHNSLLISTDDQGIMVHEVAT